MNARRWSCLALAGVAVALMAGCKSAPPKGPQTAAGPERPDPLAGWVGRTLIVRRVGDVPRAALTRAELASGRGDCDVVAQVSQARFDRGTAVITLQPLGRPRLSKRGAHEEHCAHDQPQIALTVSGFDAAATTTDLEGPLGQVLQTPEAYMSAHGVPFDLAAEKPPAEPTPEHFITVRPVRVMWVDPIRLDPARRVRHEGEVDVEGVVGADGRFYDPRLLTTISSEDEQRVLALLPLWRFEPGKRGNDRVPVKVRERMVFRIFY
jgi:hypothetical protein